jgi:hypothetical protein
VAARLTAYTASDQPQNPYHHHHQAMTNYKIENIDGCIRIAIYSDRLDADSLTLSLTPEGLIIDAIEGSDVVSTSSRMWEEVEEGLMVDDYTSA